MQEPLQPRPHSERPFYLIDNIPDNEKESFAYLSGWINIFTGLHFPPNKQINLYRRLCKLCVKFGIKNLNDLVDHLKKQDIPNLPSEMAHVISTNHSFFFREPLVLDFFIQNIVPTIPTYEKWRIWSAACASGEEAYTLAIMLAEIMGFNQVAEKVSILGTDISYPSIKQAEQGIYHRQKMELVEDAICKKYFKHEKPDHYQVDPRIKSTCTFRRMNLNNSPWPFQKQFHVVFCRNVLYYFDRPVQQELVERIFDITLPGGWLITSVTESLYWAKTRWKPIATGIYRKI